MRYSTNKFFVINNECSKTIFLCVHANTYYIPTLCQAKYQAWHLTIMNKFHPPYYGDYNVVLDEFPDSRERWEKQ